MTYKTTQNTSCVVTQAKYFILSLTEANYFEPCLHQSKVNFCGGKISLFITSSAFVITILDSCNKCIPETL